MRNHLTHTLALLTLSVSAASQTVLTHLTFGPQSGPAAFTQNTNLLTQPTANSSFQLTIPANTPYTLYFDVVARGEGVGSGSFGTVASLVVSVDVGSATYTGSGTLYTEDAFPPSVETRQVLLPPWNESVQSSGSLPHFSSLVRSQGSATVAGSQLTFVLNSRASSACSGVGGCGNPVKADGLYTLNLQSSQATLVSIQATAVVQGFGGSQSLPTLPTTGTGTFINAPSGNWFDPPLALGYRFNQLGSGLFTRVATLPVGIDGDGLFEVHIPGQSLGQFAPGSTVDFVSLLSVAGVSEFSVIGIDPAVDATNPEAFPIKLDFNAPTVNFTMTPLMWRKVGTSCSDPVACTNCPSVSLAPQGDALAGNQNFALAIQGVPGNSIGAWFVGIGSPSVTPIPVFCGAAYPPFPIINLGAAFLPGTGACDGAGSVPLPLPNSPGVFGTFLTAQSVFLCPQGALGLTHGIEFPIGN